MTLILPATLESRDSFSKERRPDFSYKLNPGQYGLDMTFPDKMDIDESRMAVWIPFADGHRRDGVGDLLEVGGINTERHRANPVVLFDHGKKVELPVGMAEDPETKEYKVVIDSVSKIAKAQAFFYQGKGLTSVDRGQEYDHAVFCEQLFDLIAKRMIRGGSIGYQVVRAVDLSPDYTTGIPKGMHLIQTLMLEASAVVMPANMDTVRKALDMSQICGKSLSPTLRKCLEPYAPERKAQFGWEKKSLFSPVESLQKVCAGFKDIVNLGPDYQVLWWNENTKTAYWVSADGDSEKDVREVESRLKRVKGVNEVVVEAETSPKGEGWKKIWPNKTNGEKSHPIDQQQSPVDQKEPDKRDWTTDETVEFKKKSVHDLRERLRMYRERDEARADRTTPTIRINSPAITTEIKQMTEDGEKLYPVDDGPEIGMNQSQLGTIIAAVVGMVLAGWGISKAVRWAIQKHKGQITPQDESKIEEAARAEVARKSNGAKSYTRAMGQGALRGAAIGLTVTAPVGMVQGGLSGYDLAHSINDDVQEAAESSDVARQYQVNRHMVAGAGAGLVGLGYGAVGAGVGALVGAGHGLVAEYLREKAEQRRVRGQKGYGRAILGGALAGGVVGATGGAISTAKPAYDNAHNEASYHNTLIDNGMRERQLNRRVDERNSKLKEAGVGEYWHAPHVTKDQLEGFKVDAGSHARKQGVRQGLMGAAVGGVGGAIVGGAAGAYGEYKKRKQQKSYARAIGRGALRGAVIGGGVGLAGGSVVGGINAGQGAYASAQGRNEQIDEINARTRSNNEVSRKRNALAAEIGDNSPMWDEDIAEHPKVSAGSEIAKATPRGALRGALLAGGIGATLGAAHGAVSGAYQQYQQNKKDKKSMRPIIVGRKALERPSMAGPNWQEEEGSRLASMLIPAAIASVVGIVAAGAGLAYAVTHVVRKMRQQGEQVTPEMEQVIADESQSKLAAMGKSQGAFLQKAYHSIRYGCKDLDGVETSVLEATDELLASTDGDVDEALMILHNTVEGIESGELEGDQSVLDFAGEVALALDEADMGDAETNRALAGAFLGLESETKGYGRAIAGGAIAGGLAGAGLGGAAGASYGSREHQARAEEHNRQLDLSPMYHQRNHSNKDVAKEAAKGTRRGGVAGSVIGGTLGAITGAGAGAINQYRRNRKQAKQENK